MLKKTWAMPKFSFILNVGCQCLYLFAASLRSPLHLATVARKMLIFYSEYSGLNGYFFTSSELLYPLKSDLA